ncbi:receptor-transporting protein 3-like [Pleuronectes platessa]|uniref:receptor-transporting protein 3-like n=1 Tax=Pleuronectes platessa TaxID=8262 RepID=UPI00232A096B|nr:receptor-transporting protein 3-like [Pleuronectes platessa]
MALGRWRSNFKSEADGLQRGDTWNLEFDSSINPRRPQPGWKEYITQTSARFSCSLCGKRWSSNNVMVVFHMHRKGRTGTVKVRRFGQKCQKCSNAPMEDPSINKTNICTLMRNLVKKIKNNCYNAALQGREYPYNKLVVTSRHKPAHCEGCIQGICTKN